MAAACAPQVRELQALVRRLESLIEMRVAEENRLSSGVSIESVRDSLEEHIAYLAAEIKQTELLIREHIGNHPDLKEQSDLLDSIPGIGAGDCRTALGGSDRLYSLQKCQTSCRLRRTGATRTAFGKFGARTHLFIENRQCATEKSSLLSGNDGSPVEQFLSGLGFWNA